MKTIKIGNDLPIAWTVLRCGTPENLSGKSLALYLTSRYGRIPVRDFEVKDNVIKFVYPGSEQKYLGEYGLMLVENSDSAGMYTVDVARAFSLVPSGAPLCECTSEIRLTSDIAVPANGLSAYEIAVLHGYPGTEDEWLEQMMNLPLKPGAGRGSLMHLEAAEASGTNSFAEGVKTTAAGTGSHVEGQGSGTDSLAHYAHAEGLRTRAIQQQAHSEGSETVAAGIQSHAEGLSTTASGHRSHSEGQLTTAAGKNSHTEGYKTTASGENSHAEGESTSASAKNSHAEGMQTEATRTRAHAEGLRTKANGDSAHTEGEDTEANGFSSHAEGQFTQTTNRAEHAQGFYNKSTKGKTLHSIGIGSTESRGGRRNAEEITTEGLMYLLGIGGYDGTNVEDNNVKPLQKTVIQELSHDADLNFVFKAGIYHIPAQIGISDIANLPLVFNNYTGAYLLVYEDNGVDTPQSQQILLSCLGDEIHIYYRQISDFSPEYPDSWTDWKEYNADVRELIAKISDPSFGGVLCLNLGNTMEADEFDRIVPQLQSILDEKKHCIVTVYDTVANEYYGDCEVIYGSAGTIRIIQNKVPSTLRAYSTIYAFDIAAKKYSRNLYSVEIASKKSVDDLRAVVGGKQGALTAGRGISIDGNNTIDCTLDTSVFKVVDMLPAAPPEGAENKIHLVPSETTETGNLYTEYLYTNGKWEKLGEFKPDVDLSNYVNLSESQRIGGDKMFTDAPVLLDGIAFGKRSSAALRMIDESANILRFKNLNNPSQTGVTLRGVATPEQSDDATNKAYVDALIQRLETAERKITELQNKLNEITVTDNTTEE